MQERTPGEPRPQAHEEWGGQTGGDVEGGVREGGGTISSEADSLWVEAKVLT